MENRENLPSPESTVIRLELTGDRKVVENLRLKKKLLDKGDKSHQQIRPVLVIGGGGQTGVISGGLGIGLERAGFSDIFDYIIGVSSGAGVGLYIPSRQAPFGASIYYEDNVKNRLINFKRVNKIMDLGQLENVLRKDKPVNWGQFRSSRSHLIVGLTNLNTGSGVFLDTENLEDPIGAVIASCCVPVLSGGKFIEINGQKYVDGSLGEQPIPVRWAIENLGATDVMVWINGPLEYKSRRLDWMYQVIAKAAAFKGYGKGIQRAVEQHIEKYNRDLDYLLELVNGKKVIKGVGVVVIAAPHSKIKWDTLNPNLLKAAAEEGTEFLFKLLTKNP